MEVARTAEERTRGETNMMDRLTERIGDRVRIKGCETLYGPERKVAYLNNAVVRLAEYEDTMLTPEEIMGTCSVDRIEMEEK